MENYPDGDYLPANCFTLFILILCPVCGCTAHAVILTREDGVARYLCGVSHDPRGTCVSSGSLQDVYAVARPGRFSSFECMQMALHTLTLLQLSQASSTALAWAGPWRRPYCLHVVAAVWNFGITHSCLSPTPGGDPGAQPQALGRHLAG